jgi:hypothetical protein
VPSLCSPPAPLTAKVSGLQPPGQRAQIPQGGPPYSRFSLPGFNRPPRLLRCRIRRPQRSGSMTLCAWCLRGVVPHHPILTHEGTYALHTQGSAPNRPHLPRHVTHGPMAGKAPSFRAAVARKPRTQPRAAASGASFVNLDGLARGRHAIVTVHVFDLVLQGLRTAILLRPIRVLTRCISPIH